MITTSRAALLLLLGLLLSFFALDREPEASAASASRRSLEQEIDGAMGTIKRSLKTLTADIEDKTKKDANLAEIQKLQVAFTTCKTATPDKIAALEGKDKEKALKEYRLMMIEVLQVTLDLEASVVDGKLPKAKKALGQIAAFEGKGHGKFKDGK